MDNGCIRKEKRILLEALKRKKKHEEDADDNRQ